MNKKILSKILIASVLAGGVNFSPVNFPANLQIVSVACAAVQNVTASETAIFDFGEDDAQIVSTVKNVAKMRAIQAAKEKAGIFIKSQTTVVNNELTEDDISAYTSNNIEILNVKYKKVPVQAHDVRGNDTGKIAFMYEATVTAKIDTAGLTAYIQRDSQEKQNIIKQNRSSQENISKISNDYDSLRNSSENVEQIKSKFNKVNDEILAQQKFDEGNKFYYNKDYQGAITEFTEAINLNPNLRQAYYNRAISYHILKSYDKAVKDFDKVLEFDSSDDFVYFWRSSSYEMSGNYEKAVEGFTKVIERNSDSFIAYSGRAKLYEKLGNYPKAIEDWTQAIRILPDSPFSAEFYKNRGRDFEALKKYDLAKKDYDQARKLNPNQIIEDYTEAIRLNPNDADLYYKRAEAYQHLEKYEQAIQDYNQAIKLNPNFQMAYYYKYLCYTFLEKDAEAKKAWNEYSSRFL